MPISWAETPAATPSVNTRIANNDLIEKNPSFDFEKGFWCLWLFFREWLGFGFRCAEKFRPNRKLERDPAFLPSVLINVGPKSHEKMALLGKTSAVLGKTTSFLGKTAAVLGKTMSFLAKSAAFLPKTTTFLAKTETFLGKTETFLCETGTLSHNKTEFMREITIPAVMGTAIAAIC
jgi:hypothetical protein